MTRAETFFFFKCYSMCKRGILKEGKRNSNYAPEEKINWIIWCGLQTSKILEHSRFAYSMMGISLTSFMRSLRG